MTAQFARAPYAARPASQPHNPQAALLIDFDNVTMGIRSDLTKELKNLLNSDIIKGKVAVQRAYADWRRYPQYIVPLAEASVDLIFAPAYGSSKKNATDIRLAIDALELVFTRSEIGTFILLSGDSDFSSLVLKLKEYGKYVVGVGIRESASDLLVQNCDEYYSYSALTGLTRAGEETGATSNDPWELVEIAVRQMAGNDDVMRSDRLKQVILELDPNFDEKTLGFPKFNRFVQEAQNRGLLSLQKMENGQYEVALPDAGAAAAADEERDGRRSRRRGRGGRRDAEPRDRGREASKSGEAVAKPPEPRQERAPEPRTERAEPRPDRAPAAPLPAAAAPSSGAAGEVSEAYALLRRATGELARPGSPVRDSDVKRRMLEIQSDWDESTYGFSKFSRFLRQAHDAEVITLRKLENGNYEVLLADGSEAEEPPARERPSRRRESADRRPKAGDLDRAATQATQPAPPEKRPAPPAAVDGAGAEAQKAEAEPSASETRPAAATQPAAARTDGAAVPARSLGVRRGSRGGRQLAGPPPLLEGQTVGPKAAAAAGSEAKPASSEAAAAASTDEAAEQKPAAARRSRGGRKRAAKSAAAPAVTTIDAAALGLPTSPAGVTEQLVGYKGVGRRSAEALVEAFGGEGVFTALTEDPDRVKEVLGARRGEALLEAFAQDLEARRKQNLQESTSAEAAANDVVASEPTADRKPRRSRGRRGGRRRGKAGAGAE